MKLTAGLIVLVCGIQALAAELPIKGYVSPDELHRQILQLSKQHPGILSVTTLAQTSAGHKLAAVSLGAKVGQAPAILIVAGLEGDDLTSAQLCLRFIESCCREYAHSENITTLLNHTTFYIFPVLNPDAAAQAFRFPIYNRTENEHSLDLDVDGSVNEDGYEDLNGDGFITQMRVPSPLGQWLPDPKNPQLLRPALPDQGEKGEYLLFSEGVDNDRDGKWNEDPSGGVDLSRNFSYRYPYFANGSGHYPMSEIETHALAEFCFAHGDIAAVFTFSSNGNLCRALTTGNNHADSKDKPLTAPMADDIVYINKVGEQYRTLFKYSSMTKEMMTAGSCVDWAYYHYGRWAFSAPAWSPGATDDSLTNTDPLLFERRLYSYLEKTDQLNKFVPWQEIRHPDFPDASVEAGGFIPYVGKNPPADSLNSITDRYSQFWQELASMLPIIEINSRVERLYRGVYRITAIISNGGKLPTCSRIGERLNWLQKIKIEAALTESQKMESGNLYYLLEAIPPGQSVEKSWIIRTSAPGPLLIKASAPSVGSAANVVQLD
ncbi:MAG: hypothetical protein EHM72_05390 [Calditrichaeota bacterium]|nr:MAG: hypothetical protein EHM72_05390 [Calditrichota bacterium]